MRPITCRGGLTDIKNPLCFQKLPKFNNMFCVFSMLQLTSLLSAYIFTFIAQVNYLQIWKTVQFFSHLKSNLSLSLEDNMQCCISKLLLPSGKSEVNLSICHVCTAMYNNDRATDRNLRVQLCKSFTCCTPLKWMTFKCVNKITDPRLLTPHPYP